MSNTKKIASIAFTGAAATAAAMMGAGPAFAAGSTFVIKAGGVKIVPPVTVKGKIKTGTTAKLVDTTKHTTLTCKKATTSGTLSVASGVTPKKVGVINAATWSSCTGPFGLTFKAHLLTKPNLIVNTANAAGATGKLSGNKISGKISGTGLFNTCRATISGTSVPAKYVNASHVFAVNTASPHAVTLHVKSIAGNCAGAINVSDNAYFSATYVVSVPANLTIS